MFKKRAVANVVIQAAGVGRKRRVVHTTAAANANLCPQSSTSTSPISTKPSWSRDRLGGHPHAATRHAVSAMDYEAATMTAANKATAPFATKHTLSSVYEGSPRHTSYNSSSSGSKHTRDGVDDPSKRRRDMAAAAATTTVDAATIQSAKPQQRRSSARRAGTQEEVCATHDTLPPAFTDGTAHRSPASSSCAGRSNETMTNRTGRLRSEGGITREQDGCRSRTRHNTEGRRARDGCAVSVSLPSAAETAHRIPSPSVAAHSNCEDHSDKDARLSNSYNSASSRRSLISNHTSNESMSSSSSSSSSGCGGGSTTADMSKVNATQGPLSCSLSRLRAPLLHQTDSTARQEDEAFARILENVRAMTEPLADLDETMQADHNNDTGIDTIETSSAEGSPCARVGLPVSVTHRTFHASLVCPKKFYLMQHRSDLLPRSSIGEVVHFDDTVGFGELARRWDRLQFGSKAIVVHEREFDQAVQRTEDIVTHYFQTTYASLGEQAPSLTIHRPALMAPFGGNRSHSSDASSSPPSSHHIDKQQQQQQLRHHPLHLRARPCVLRYRPKDNQWVILHAHPVVDPMGTTARAAYHLQRFHFAVLVFRYWITQPHIPISVRKRFLQIDLDGINAENAQGRMLESSARVVAAPIDLKRSGMLHIRQFFPGPATLLDCDPQRLVKFVQRLSLEEMLEMDARQQQQHQHGGGGRAAGGGQYRNSFGGGGGGAVSGAFDLHGLNRVQPKSAAHAVQAALAAMRECAGRVNGHSARSTRSTRAKDMSATELFASQQQLLELLLTHVTLPLVQRTRAAAGESDRALWTCFSRDDAADGLVRARGVARGTEGGPDQRATGAMDACDSAHRDGEPNGNANHRNSRDTNRDSMDSDENTDDPRKEEEEEEDRDRKRYDISRSSSSSSSSSRDGSHTDMSDSACRSDSRGDGARAAPSSSQPAYSAYLGAHCSRGELCPFFREGCCLPRHVANPLAVRDNHLFTIPSVSVTRKVGWWSQGMRSVGDVLRWYKAGTVKLTAPQLRYAKAVTDGCVAVNPREVDAFFARIHYPAFFIDFEAVQFAMPPFARQVAYQSIPFQFSLDVFQHDILTETPTHYDFLHFGKNDSPNADPRRPCLEELMRIVKLEREKRRAAMEQSGELAAEEAARLVAADTSADGAKTNKRGRRRGAAAAAVEDDKASGQSSARAARLATKSARNPSPESRPATPYDGCFIAHYAAFEKSCLEKLGQLEERHKDEIRRFVFLDTMELFRKGFIHPNTHGSNSLKKVLPALCPDIQYGVFGSEDDGRDDGGGDGDNAAGSATTAVGQDEQKGENAMGVYRLWVHQESGNNIHELHRSQAALHASGSTLALPMAKQVHSGLAVHASVAPEVRDRAWAMLRIQLLEYCSLDTKALYEIMREMHREAAAARNEPPSDRTGWVFSPPMPRETML